MKTVAPGTKARAQTKQRTSASPTKQGLRLISIVVQIDQANLHHNLHLQKAQQMTVELNMKGRKITSSSSSMWLERSWCIKGTKASTPKGDSLEFAGWTFWTRQLQLQLQYGDQFWAIGRAGGDKQRMLLLEARLPQPEKVSDRKNEVIIRLI